MDSVGVAGLILSAVGVGLSIYALVKADSANKAVEKVIRKSDNQTTRDDARRVLSLLGEAREAAMANRKGASPVAIKGRSKQDDLRTLQLAQDVLATTTLSDDLLETQALRQAAQAIDRALASISTADGRDGWAEALAALQGVTPKVDALQRRLGSQSLR